MIDLQTDYRVAGFERLTLASFGKAVLAEIKDHPRPREVALGLVEHMGRVGEPPAGLDLSDTIAWFSAMLADFDRGFAARVRARFVM